ncbi:hypothetical protein KKB44_02775 [Candidatus Micrarchaeota archaeon]|nr:hypothetical protein [Candidatus Micrarchaeota archaeon]
MAATGRMRRQENVEIGGQQYVFDTRLDPGTATRDMLLDRNTTITRPDGSTINGGSQEARDLAETMDREGAERSSISEEAPRGEVTVGEIVPRRVEERRSEEAQEWVGRRTEINGRNYWVELPREVANEVTGDITQHLHQARIYNLTNDGERGEMISRTERTDLLRRVTGG